MKNGVIGTCTYMGQKWSSTTLCFAPPFWHLAIFAQFCPWEICSRPSLASETWDSKETWSFVSLGYNLTCSQCSVRCLYTVHITPDRGAILVNLFFYIKACRPPELGKKNPIKCCVERVISGYPFLRPATSSGCVYNITVLFSRHEHNTLFSCCTAVRM